MSLADRAAALILLTVIMMVGLFTGACSAEPQARGLPVATLLASAAGEGGRGEPDHSHGMKPDVAPSRVAEAVGTSLPSAVDLVISEVMSDPLVVADVVGEYVEVIYLGAEPASLAGVELVLPDGRALQLVRPAVVPAKDGGARGKRHARRRRTSQVRVTGVAADGVVRPGQVVVVWSTRAVRLRLSNRAGRVELRRGGDVLDVAQWAGRWPWPKHRAGRALCRVAADRDGGMGRSWRWCRARLRQVERGDPGVVGGVCAWLRARNVRLARCEVALGGARRRRGARLRRSCRR